MPLYTFAAFYIFNSPLSILTSHMECLPTRVSASIINLLLTLIQNKVEVQPTTVETCAVKKKWLPYILARVKVCEHQFCAGKNKLVDTF